MFFVGENLWAKGVQKFSGKFGEILAKILHTPKNLPAPTPIVRPFDSEPSLLTIALRHRSRVYLHQ